MGDHTPFPGPDAVARAESFTHEQFVFESESFEAALAPGSARRRALDRALEEIEAGASAPSVKWRQEFSLLLGLERMLSEDEPKLVDGTVLSAHQVDALSGTLTALLAEAQRRGNGNGNGNSHGNGGTGHGGHGDADDDTAGAGAGARSAPASGTDSPASGRSAGKSGGASVEAGLSGDEPDDEDEEHDEDTPEPDEVGEEEEPQDWSDDADEEAELASAEALEDPNAAKRFWFEHATGAGKTVAALGFVEASRTGGTLILTHRRNLVDQFNGELRDRGYSSRISPPLLGDDDPANGPVTVETYQWFVRNAGKVSDAYTIVICDEAHTALGEKTSASIRSWDGPIFIGMTATGALIARHVTDLFPTQTSRFDLAQAARRGVISPLRCIRIPPGPGVRTIAKVPLRRGEVDTEFDQEMLAELLDQTPFNLAIADLYKTRFNGIPGVVYAAGVKHAYNVAQSFRDLDMKAQAVSGETPKRELATILADYESGKIDVLVNAQLLAEGWNSPRATVCMHLAPTASKRIYQQRVGRVTRRHPGKEAGIVVDFVHPATKHDDPVVTLHSLLDRDVYRGGAIVVGPVRRGRGRRVRVERRVLPVTPEPERRAEVFERELWRIAVENLDYGEQHVWAALAGARVASNGWRRAKAMLHFDRQGELRRRFLLTALQRNKSSQLRLRALQEIAGGRDAEAFDLAVDMMAGWTRDERREGVKIMLAALAERRIGRRDQANGWIWRMAEYTREVHEEYAVQRWPETKRLLGLLVNSSGPAHARNARRIVHAARQQERRLSAALLAASLAHTPEAQQALDGARTRLARKPAALARDLLRNFPKGKRSKTRRRRKAGAADTGAENVTVAVGAEEMFHDGDELYDEPGGAQADREELELESEVDDDDLGLNGDDLGDAAPGSEGESGLGLDEDDGPGAEAGGRAGARTSAARAARGTRAPRRRTPRRRSAGGTGSARAAGSAEPAEAATETSASGDEAPREQPVEKPRRRRTSAPRKPRNDSDAVAAEVADETAAAPKPRSTRTARPAEPAHETADAPKPRGTRAARPAEPADETADAPKPRRGRRSTPAEPADETPTPRKPRTSRRATAPEPAAGPSGGPGDAADRIAAAAARVAAAAAAILPEPVTAVAKKRAPRRKAATPPTEAEEAA